MSSNAPESNGASQHPTESYQSRVQRKTMSKRQAVNDALEDTEKVLVEEAKQKGLLCCDALDAMTRARCNYQCTSQNALDAHKQSGKHHFPSRDLKDQAIAFVCMEGGKLEYGSRVNRSQVHANHEVLDGKEEPTNSSDTHFAAGCYVRPSREKAKPYSAELKRLLIIMFEAGESTDGEDKHGKNKYTPKSALDSLRTMRNKAGLLKFSSTSEFGELPTEAQIKGFWYRYKESRNKKHANKDTKKQHDEWVDAALDAVDEENENDKEADTTTRDNGTRKRQTALRKNSNKSKDKGKLDKMVFLVDGTFEAYIDHGNVALEALIKSHGGKILKKLSKNVGENHCLVYIIYLTLQFLTFI